tara:strand:+ start:130 stop:708 length:579 start_codon:yes stop_codon:yes gene_type:complete
MRIILISILLVSLQSFSQAQNIKEFEIEGISVGDSLLNFFDAEKIKSGISNTLYKSDKFVKVDLRSPKFETYEILQFHVKKNSNYTISMISGGIFFDDINDCHKKMIEMDKDVSDIFKNLDRKESGPSKHRADASGESTFKSIYYYLDNRDGFRVSCFDWSEKFTKERNYFDHLKLTIFTDEVRLWIINEAY